GFDPRWSGADGSTDSMISLRRARCFATDRAAADHNLRPSYRVRAQHMEKFYTQLAGRGLNQLYCTLVYPPYANDSPIVEGIPRKEGSLHLGESTKLYSEWSRRNLRAGFRFIHRRPSSMMIPTFGFFKSWFTIEYLAMRPR